jgi:hypothetical protein
MMVVQYFLNADDDTYIFGDEMFECEYNEETNTYIQPFIRQDGDRIIKFYRDEQFFVVYKNAMLIEIVKTMTCWSDDVIHYKLNNGVAYEYDETYHGRPHKKGEVCDVDFSEFISKNGL